MWFACHTQSLSLPSPFCFWLCMPACSQRRLNIEVLFSLRIDVFSFPLHSLARTDTHTHECWREQHTEAVLTPDADGDSLLKRKSSQYDWSLLWGALFSSSILQGIFVSQHCEICFFSLCLCVCVCVCSRERVFPLSVVFVSVTVLITNCLIFQLIENRYCSV